MHSVHSIQRKRSTFHLAWKGCMEDGFHEKEVHWDSNRLWELEREM